MKLHLEETGVEREENKNQQVLASSIFLMGTAQL